MKLRKTRQFRRGRIEIIPMVDVMFFLLATFMLASLSMQRLNSLPVDLPQGEAAPLQAPQAITLTVARDGGISVDKIPVTLDTLVATLKAKMHSGEDSVIVSADEFAPQGQVVQAMLRARQAGATHFLIAVQSG